MATSTMQNSTESVNRNGLKKATKRKAQTRNSPKNRSRGKSADGFTTHLYRHGMDAATNVYDSAQGRRESK